MTQRYPAFEAYLLSQPRSEAVGHFIACLKSGGEMAWDLMEQVHGAKWSCPPDKLPRLVVEVLEALPRLPQSESE